jgi:hypothetical protein
VKNKVQRKKERYFKIKRQAFSFLLFFMASDESTPCFVLVTKPAHSGFSNAIITGTNQRWPIKAAGSVRITKYKGQGKKKKFIPGVKIGHGTSRKHF